MNYNNNMMMMMMNMIILIIMYPYMLTRKFHVVNFPLSDSPSYRSIKLFYKVFYRVILFAHVL